MNEGRIFSDMLHRSDYAHAVRSIIGPTRLDVASAMIPKMIFFSSVNHHRERWNLIC